MSDRDNRPSWRELDRKKDRSDHRKDNEHGRGPRVDSARSAYLRQANAIFDKGELPAHLKAKMEEAGIETGGDGNLRQKAMRAVRQAESGPALNEAIDALRKEFGLPDDLEILLRCLEHPRDVVLREALDLIEPHVERGDRLPNKKVFVRRLEGLEFTSFDPRVQRKAIDLAARSK